MKSKAEKVISLRVSGDWVNLLEKLGKKWDTNLSDTVRKVLSFYFLSSSMRRSGRALSIKERYCFN